MGIGYNAFLPRLSKEPEPSEDRESGPAVFPPTRQGLGPASTPIRGGAA